ncbi:MAG: hypothetical protein KDI13_05300 [Alphaproteobacteria bacterium]|nr:hypothetical protein [Alphaproteobacteria bacterium]
MSKKKYLFIIAQCIFFISACTPQGTKNSADIKIIETIVNGENLYIPHAYLKFGYTSVGDKSGFLQAYYPGSSPVPGDPKELFKQGEWYKNVRILFTNYPKPNPQGVLQNNIETQKTDKTIGEEYGLVHLTQSDQDQAFHRDIWVDSFDDGSFIRCSKKTDADDPVQICEHLFNIGQTSLSISYDKRLLPEWKLIKKNVWAMYESFKSPKTAIAYITEFYPNPQAQGKMR